ncbi:hypothetical protein AB0B94_30395 [Micromonospora sp. NPDC048986]|uniref:hypothetical protein n=1 Tax=Micromonospora sp. NPDC048986 TaxID=3155644 RepID=UPI0033FD6646
MSFDSKTFVVVTCDGKPDCKPWIDGASPHFDGLLDALAWLRDNGWLVADTRLLCPVCTRVAECEATSHTWSDWLPTETNGVRYRWRWCERCNEATETDPPLEVLIQRGQAALDAEQILSEADRTLGGNR